jgi:hypothetical protein
MISNSQREIDLFDLFLYLRSRMKRNPQLKLFKSEERAYGGELLKKRKGRLRGRPLDTKNSMHLVLRSSKATGKWSFRNPRNMRKVEALSLKFCQKYGIKLLSLANVGNHLHYQIKLGNRFTYKPFIRALTASIAMAITGASRWNKVEIKFWDYRPFTRVVVGWSGFLKLRDYVRINQWEGLGYVRNEAHFIVKSRGNKANWLPNTS